MIILHHNRGNLMEICLAIIRSLSILISLLDASVADDARIKTSNSNITVDADNPNRIEERGILNRDSTDYTEVRHIFLSGINVQISRALGQTAQKDYNVTTERFAGPVYFKARLIYVQKDNPTLYQRVKGEAEAYNIIPQHHRYRSQRSSLWHGNARLHSILFPTTGNI
jgi:hypothetical protein